MELDLLEDEKGIERAEKENASYGSIFPPRRDSCEAAERSSFRLPRKITPARKDRCFFIEMMGRSNPSLGWVGGVGFL